MEAAGAAVGAAVVGAAVGAAVGVAVGVAVGAEAEAVLVGALSSLEPLVLALFAPADEFGGGLARAAERGAICGDWPPAL